MSHLKRRIVYLAAAIAFCLATGTVGFTLLQHCSVFEAFYFTLITITTVGYNELRGLTQAGRIFNVFLVITGVTTMFFAIGLMTQTMVELQLLEFFGKRRIRRMIEKLDHHYIVCGFGRVGHSAALEIQRAGAPLVVIDRNPDKVERAARAGLLAMTADSTRDQALHEAGITRARGLIAALATDADNLFVILSAKNLNPGLFVAARVDQDEAEGKLLRAGADQVFAPYRNAGRHLALSMLRPHVVQFLDQATTQVGLDIAMEQVQVGENSVFASKSLLELQLRRDLGVIVLAIRKAGGEMHFNPPAEAIIQRGDCLIVMGEPGNLRKLETMLAGVQV